MAELNKNNSKNPQYNYGWSIWLIVTGLYAFLYIYFFYSGESMDLGYSVIRAYIISFPWLWILGYIDAWKWEAIFIMVPMLNISILLLIGSLFYKKSTKLPKYFLILTIITSIAFFGYIYLKPHFDKVYTEFLQGENALKNYLAEGKVTIDHCAVQPDGKLIISATLENVKKLIRLKTDGQLDETFWGMEATLGQYNEAISVLGNDSFFLLVYAQSCLYTQRLNPNENYRDTLTAYPSDFRLLAASQHTPAAFLWTQSTYINKKLEFPYLLVQPNIPAKIIDMRMDSSMLLNFNLKDRSINYETFTTDDSSRVYTAYTYEINSRNKSGGIWIFSPNGDQKNIPLPISLNNIWFLTVSKNGILYALVEADVNHEIKTFIYCWDKEGKPTLFKTIEVPFVQSFLLDTIGRIIVADSFEEGLVRYNANGSVDEPFKQKSMSTPLPSYARALDIDSLGRIYVSVHPNNKQTILRFLPDGKLDHTFKTYYFK